MSKRDILRGYRTFSRIISEGQSLQRSMVCCFYLAEPAQQFTRVGFSVSRNVRNAVERNRARRWMKEAYRKNKTILSIAPPQAGGAISVVFMLKSRGALAKHHEFRAEVDHAIITLLHDLQQKRSGKP